ncbi:hypothetical protein [Bdellovibrio svalbardensis]|uniref:SPOR domain-containing protein n=1 Tax=Bdellovibrio svalbardensis TaxID=2972972 RepID=A0ABT6DL87_9BACT|nr:hypothetical protein [Bdellovibrio svalbardensis]MDG0817277.1 hypothetical protein [Bdellovibrio svalbardensis]
MANHEAEVEAPAEVSSAYESSAQDYSASQDFNAGYNNEVGSQTQTNYSSEQAPEQSFQAEQNYGTDGNYQTDQGEAIEPTAEVGYSPDQNYSSEQSYESQGEVSQDSAYSEAVQEPVFEETPFDFNRTLDQAPAQAPPPVSVSDSSDFSDVTDFANADTAAGPITYVVVIDGIESSHLLYQLKEAMTDSRFGWDVAELLTTVGGGRLVLPGLTPAKASVLINRIKYLPFKISWRQDVLSSS